MPCVCENVVKDGVLGGGVGFSEKLDLNKMIEEDNFDPLYALSTEGLLKSFSEQCRSAGILNESEGVFIQDAFKLLEGGMDLIKAAVKLLLDLLSYSLHATLSSSEGREILEDGLPGVAESLLAAYDSRELLGALEEGKSGWQKWV